MTVRVARLLVVAVLLAEALALLAPPLLNGGLPVPLNHLFAIDLAYHDDFQRLSRDREFTRLPVNSWLGDVYLVFHPWYLYARERLGAGEAPLWDPHSLGGYPIYANWQFTPFDPFAVLTYALPVGAGMLLRMALRLLAASSGAYLLARSIGSSRAGALVAATAFSLSGPITNWLEETIGGVGAVLPWMLLATLHLHRRGGGRAVALLAIAFGCSYHAGHVENSFLGALAATVLALWLARNAPRGERLRRISRFGLAATLGAVLAATLILPFEEGLRLSGFAGRAPEPIASRLWSALRGRAPLESALGAGLGTVFYPEVAGSPVRLRQPAARKSPPLMESNSYAGLLTLALAGLAVGAGTGPARAIAAGTLLALAVALRLPLVDLVNQLPILAMTNTARLRVVFTLGVALLGGLGLDALRGTTAERSRRWARWAWLGLAFAALHVTLTVSLLDVRGVRWATQGDLLGACLAFVAAAAAVWILARLRMRPLALGALAVGFIGTDLLAHGFGFNSYVLAPHAAIEPPAVTFLRRQTGLFRIGRSDPRVLVGNQALRFGLQDSGGHDIVYPRTIADLQTRFGSDPGAAVHDLQNERFLLAPAGSRLDLKSERLRLVHQDGGVEVYERPGAFPRAFLARARRLLTSDAEILEALDSSPLRDTVLTTETAMPEIDPGDVTAEGDDGEATVELYRPERVVILSRAPGARYLVLSDTFYPGWQAEVDGVPARIWRVDHAFRAVAVPAGAHRIEMRFEPWRWRWGARLSLAALFACVVLLARGGRKREAVTAPPGARSARALVAAVFVAEALLLLAPPLLERALVVPLNQLYATDLAYRASFDGLARDPVFNRLPVNTWLGDVALAYDPAYRFIRRSFAVGRPPLWNPGSLLGYPIYANSWAAPYDLPSLVSYSLPFDQGLLLRLFLRLLIASVGAYRLARIAGASRPGATLAGTVYALSGPFVGWLGSVVAAVAAWLPWILLATVKLARHRRARDGAALALFFAAAYQAGHLETAFLAGLAAAATALALAIQGRPRQRALPGLAGFAAAAFLGVVAAAVQVLPFEEAFRLSRLAAVRRHDQPPLADRTMELAHGGDPGRWLADLATVVFPEVAGSPHRYHAPGPRKSPNLIESNAYVGLLSLAFAGAALFGRVPGILMVAAGGGLALAIAAGLPVVGLVSLLPLVDVTRIGRLRLVWALAVAVLAALGFDRLRGAGEPGSRRWRRATRVAAAVAAVFVALDLAWLERHGLRWATTGEMVAAALSLALLAAVASVLVRTRQRERGFAALVIALVALDLLAHGLQFNTYVTRPYAAIEPGVVGFLRAAPGVFRFGRTTPAILIPNTAWRWGLQDFGGYEHAYPAAVRAIHDRYEGDPQSAVHDLLNERYLLAPAGSRLDAQNPRLKPVYRDSGIEAYERLDTFPRAFLARTRRLYASEAEVLVALAGPGLRSDVLTSDASLPVLGPAQALVAGDAPDSDPVIEVYQPDRVVLRTRAKGPRYLVLSDAWYPGWRATIDGSPTPIHRVDLALRGVVLDAGEHVVEMRFVPWRWRWGIGITVVTWVTLGAIAVSGGRRRRQRRGDAT